MKTNIPLSHWLEKVAPASFLTVLLTACAGVLASVSFAASTINPTERYAYGANIGWMDWRPSTADGVVIGEFVCSGYIYAANVGWIHLGNGTPANGIRYQNNSGTDYGVNHDGQGNLRGLAWGANIGWVNFEAVGAPKVDLLTGLLTGFLYGANVGWISLSNVQATLRTDLIQRSLADSDADGIPDAWELLRAGNLTTLQCNGDADGDGQTDCQEYLADTDPLDPNSTLGITAYSASPGGAINTITWTSVPTRVYRILKTNDVMLPFGATDVGLGFILPDAGTTTTRSFADTPAPQRFFRVQALKPLSP